MKVVCFGDSNTFGYNPCAKFGECYDHRWTDILSEISGWEVVNEGVNGREVPDTPAWIPDNTDLFLVMLGTNDLLQLDTPEAATDRMKLFLSGSDVNKTVLLAPPAMVWGDWVQEQELIDDSVRLGRLYSDLAIEVGVKFLNTAEWNLTLCYDGVHLTQESQEVFARRLYHELSAF